MRPCLILVICAWLMSASITWADPGITGQAKYYRSGLMEEVATRRGLDLEGYEDGIALMDCGLVGREAWLQWPGEKDLDGRYLVVDCVAPQHLAARQRDGDVVEVGWKTAQERKMRGPIDGVKVWLVGQTKIGRW